MRLLVAVLAVVLLLSGCAAEAKNGNDAAQGTGFTSGDGTWTVIPTAQRATSPVLAGQTLEGKQVSTADYLGKPVVINVWGSWCAPCRAEAAELVAAQAALGEKVHFLGVNTRDLDVNPALAFQRAFKVSYPSIFDPNGELLLEFGQLPPKAIPSTVVLDAQGRLAARVVGAVNAVTLQGILEDVQAGS